MSYLKIPNLYRCTEYLKLFKMVWVTEKIHGSSAHLQFLTNPYGNDLRLFAGGCDHLHFSSLFNKDELIDLYKSSSIYPKELFLYGEVFGGKLQGMKKTYGDKLDFIVFDVKIEDKWLDIPNAIDISQKFNQKFVWHKEIENTLENLNFYRDQPSQLAILKNCGDNKLAEGIVSKPLHECYDRNGGRYIVKHKRDEFMETSTPREVDPEYERIKLQGQAVVDDLVTQMRFNHIIDKGQWTSREDIPEVIEAMLNDISVECSGEYVDSKIVRKLIGNKTVSLFKEYINQRLDKSQSV